MDNMEHHPTTRFVTIVKDEVTQRPSRSGIGSRRSEPAFFCFGVNSHTELAEFLEEAQERLDDIRIVADKYDLEVDLFGKRGRLVSTKRAGSMRNLLDKSKENSEHFQQCQSTLNRSSPMPGPAKKQGGEIDDPTLED
mmetsp:Transcript_10595/g.25593  ORF Transcript_10595/g.25593 Transcript_10595/m.25593 type:complete len:138 (-) Transcript_10595:1154-1567(-)